MLRSIVVYPLVMGIVIHYFLPVYDGLKLTTSYQYLELREGLWQCGIINDKILTFKTSRVAPAWLISGHNAMALSP